MRWAILFLCTVTAACDSDKSSQQSLEAGTTPEKEAGAQPAPDASSKPKPASDAGGAGTEGDASGPPRIVALDDGQVEGDNVGGAHRFLKIPFAKPPVGDLRWKAPVKNDPWTGIRHETSFATGCPQNMSSQGPASTSEDCLYLNVWAPDPAPAKAPGDGVVPRRRQLRGLGGRPPAVDAASSGTTASSSPSATASWS